MTVSMLGRLLWPDQLPITPLEREQAVDALAAAAALGSLTDEQVQRRRRQLSVARTRADLNLVLRGLPGTSTTGMLSTATRLATVLWLLATAVQFVVWLLVMVTTLSVDSPWWLWTAVPGGLVVAALWFLSESERRSRGLVSAQPAPARRLGSDEWTEDFDD